MLNFKKINERGETSVVQSVMIALLIVAAFFIGMLWTKVQNYENGANGTGSGNIVKPTPVGDAGVGQEPVDAPPAEITIAPVTEKDWVRGNRNARIAIIEWSDLECPFCKSFHPTIQQLIKEYGNEVMWVYRHFPLDQLHAKARNEAAASECAGKLGGEAKFWAYIDKIYEITPANDGLDPAKLPEIAKELGLNVNAFNTCLTSTEVKDLVQEDFMSGVAAGINGTPGGVIFDTKTGESVEIGGAVPYASLKQMLEDFKAKLK